MNCVDRTADGTGYIKDFTYSQLRQLEIETGSVRKERILSIAEVLDLLQERMRAGMLLNIELKNGSMSYDEMEDKILDYPCETAQYLPAANELCHPFRSGRGAFILWQRHSALCRPLPERYRAVPRYDDKAGGSGRRVNALVKSGKEV